jgi:hypothetical protein
MNKYERVYFDRAPTTGTEELEKLTASKITIPDLSSEDNPLGTMEF